MPKSQHTKTYERVAMELKVARVRAKLSQKQAAEKLGESQSFISKIEMGERRVDIVELRDLCHLYGMTLGQFLAQVGID
jgi:transcriptional regulator with XRE-family HTH domain